MDKSSSLSNRVTIEIADGVAEVTLNRPDKLNALDPAMFEAIIAAGERVSQTAGLRAIVLAGAGKSFCAGLDKETFASLAVKGAPALGDLTKRTHGIANAFQREMYSMDSNRPGSVAAVSADQLAPVSLTGSPLARTPETIERTCRCKNERALTRQAIRSASHVTAKASSVRSGEFA